jgi:hypothetical protein
VGMNIYPVRLTSDGRVRGPAERWFDSTRYAGDRDFIASPIEWTYRPDPSGSDMPHCRPTNPEKAREWIRISIESAGNRDRLIALIDWLEANQDGWIEISV